MVKYNKIFVILLNTIRLYCDYSTMPDIDYMTINMQ